MPTRPTGTVTFLFSDIEGSTRHWERHPALMAAAFARQEAILRAAIAAHGGWAYKQIGDAFQAAFQTAAAALAAAVAAQQALAAEPWPAALGSIRVRMALHTGATDERADDYVGPVLNRAARLLSAGHGGQVLLTLATAELVRDTLPAGVTLHDLGAHRLKDLIRPEHVWQADAVGWAHDFPPLKTLDARPNNLPAQPNAFIGREEQIATVIAQLRRSDVRLVTLTGPGGTGKTRLAQQVAAALLDDFPAGVWFVDLAPLVEPDLVPTTIARVLNVTEQGTMPIRESLQVHLRDKQLLLVLDNYEQVVAAAPLVPALLHAAPRLRVLVTSRVPLRVYGEHEMPVPPLGLPDPDHLPPLDRLTQYEAVRLFIAAACAVQPGFAVTNETAPAVAEICVRLDGLPLAIELAAARSRLFAPLALLARLDGRLQVLTGGGRDRPARQQTLRGALAWSYDLLTPGEQQLFRRIAVFQGGCTLEAITAICAAGGPAGSGEVPALAVDVLDGVEALTGQSLLQQRAGADGEPRFAMLETIHEYAHEQLAASGEERALRDAHLAYFTALAEGATPALALAGSAAPAWLDRLEEEHANVRAALGWARAAGTGPGRGLALAAAIWPFWSDHGYWREGRAHLTAALESLGPAPLDPGDPAAGAAGRALLGAGRLALWQDDYPAARSLLAQARALAAARGDTTVRAAALTSLANTAIDQGDYPAARALLEEGLALYRQLSDQPGAGRMLGYLGAVELVHGDYAAARALLEQRLILFQELREPGGIASSLCHLGAVVQHQGDYAAARALLEEGLSRYRAMGDQAGVAHAFLALGNLAQVQGDYPAARDLYTQSLGLYRGLGERAALAHALTQLGHTAQLQGDTAGAGAAYGESLQIVQDLGAKASLAISLAGLGGVAAAGGQAEQGARLLGSAAALLASTGSVLGIESRQVADLGEATARAVLGDAAFAAAYAAGQGMALAAALNLAQAAVTASSA